MPEGLFGKFIKDIRGLGRPEDPRVDLPTTGKEEKPEAEPVVAVVTEEKPTPKEREKKIDKGPYESIATNNYFEGWDEDLELEGNPELKGRIRENIIRAEKIHQGRYEDAARDCGLSVEEFKARLQAKIEDMLQKANFFRATPVDILERIMTEDGRWKSQFETGRSNGTLDPRFRAAAEIKMFGFNQPDGWQMPAYREEQGVDLAENVLTDHKEKRPIYGYFSDDEHGAINNEGKIPPPNNVNFYGNINVKIKQDRALKKATITFQDSLSDGDKCPPTPAVRPHFTSFRLSYGGRVVNALKGSSLTNWGSSYTEVQYHGGLTMDDVESIHMSPNNNLYRDDIERVRKMVADYNQRHPEAPIPLIEF